MELEGNLPNDVFNSYGFNNTSLYEARALVKRICAGLL